MLEVPSREGRTYKFSPDSMALVAIDMQRDFCSPGGVGDSGGENISPVERIIPNVKKVLGSARTGGMFVCHMREGHTPDLSTLHAMRRLSSLQAGAEIGKKGPLGRFLVRGEYGHEFVGELQPLPGEPVFDKPGFGAFYKTELDQTLRLRGISHLVVCGVTTECCIQSTIREAIDRGFFVLTLEDCRAAYYQDMHDAAMRLLPSQGGLFGWVGKPEAFLEVLGRAEKAASAAE